MVFQVQADAVALEVGILDDTLLLRRVARHKESCFLCTAGDGDICVANETALAIEKVFQVNWSTVLSQVGVVTFNLGVPLRLGEEVANLFLVPAGCAHLLFQFGKTEILRHTNFGFACLTAFGGDNDDTGVGTCTIDGRC